MGNQTVCIGDVTTLVVDFTGTGPFSFTWTDSLSYVNVNNAGDPYILSVSPTENSVITISSVTQANGCTNTGTGQGNISVNQLSQIVTNPVDKTVCPGDNITFKVTASGTGLGYQWQKDGVPIPGATNSNLILNNVLAADAGNFTCVVTSSCGPPLTNARYPDSTA